MKATIKQQDLAKALQITGKTCKSNSRLSILTHVLITTRNQEVEISTTQLETGICWYVPANVSEDGAVAINHKQLTSIVRGLKKDEYITISSTQDKILSFDVTITCTNSSMTLSSLDAAEFPPMHFDQSDYTWIDIDTSNWHENNILQKVFVSTATDEARPVLSGVNFDFTSGKLVGCDGFRLSVQDMPYIKNGNKPVNVPNSSIKVLIDLLKKSTHIRMGISKKYNRIIFMDYVHTFEVISNTVDGPYPDYNVVIPNRVKYETFVQANDVLNACKQLASFMDKGMRIAEFTFADKNLTITAKNEGSMSVNISCESNFDLKIGFNVDYLIDILQFFTGSISLEFVDAISPVKIKEAINPDFLYLLMPVRLDK